VRGAEVLAPIANFHPRLADAVLAHHERWDGQGYPRGLKGRKIPLAARVVALADTFDVVTHGRKYRDGRGTREAEEIILHGRGTQFDPELVDLMLLPPVFDRIMRAQRAAFSHGRNLPNRRARATVESAQPKVRMRWRTQTPPPKSVREKTTSVR
jgi:response regulator RpfG family c-di-GMP phosphodiesterase